MSQADFIQKYQDFLKSKIVLETANGFTVDESEVNPILKPHQRAAVCWALRGGRRALFEAFGLGKTMQQLELLRLVLEKLGKGRALIIAPLGVRQEFKRDAVERLGWQEPPLFVRRTEDVWNASFADGTPQVFITNYESVRDHRLDVNLFDVVTLDEASCLRGFGGTKTFREFMGLFAGDLKTLNERTRSEGMQYRFVATATPSPNDYIELLAYAAFLGVMDVSAAKTRFFKRDSQKADHLTIHPHKEREFWLWVSSWALFLQSPADLGYDDTGYALPEMRVIKHEVCVDHSKALADSRGQHRLFREANHGVIEAAREKRETLPERIKAMQAILASNPDDHFLIWHDLEAERHAIEQAVSSAVSVYGTQDLEAREQAIIDFSDGKIQYLAAKPVIAGSGCNFQRHCHKAIFLGIGFKFNDFIQAIHRIHRFLQNEPVEIHIIYAESERSVLQTLEKKWEQHNQMVKTMTEIIKKYGLSQEAMAQDLNRAFGVERVEVKGQNHTLIHNDCILEAAHMLSNSIDLIITSIPFGTQYEWSPNYADFGHTDTAEHFWQQMDFLTPNLLRVLRPGRIAAIHVKDRNVPGGISGLGFQTVYPFHADCIAHFIKHSFGYLGMKTIVTDVVRENNKTYRLGWTEQCKDGTKIGVGMPEYVLLFRKPPTDSNNAYADTPVVKTKTAYTRGRWVPDAHGFSRSSGERLLNPDELRGLTALQISRLFKQYTLTTVYDFDYHVRLGDALEATGKLPNTFMLLQPQSWSPDVWTDITQMRNLNSSQYAKGKDQHLCPLQFDIVDRTITQFSMPGETVLDPFAGLCTVPYRAIKLGRKGIGIELSHSYFLDGAMYCAAAEQELLMPSLFDISDVAEEEHEAIGA
jgi:DNA modification methylase